MFELERIRVAETMRRLYDRRLTTVSGGNVSMRNAEGYVFITASQSDKSCIDMRKVIILSPEGDNLTPKLKPSMETQMHLSIYKSRPDVFAIVHSHPVYASTFAVAEMAVDSAITGEARYMLGNVGMVEYHLMGSPELADACAKVMSSANAAIMAKHGAITLGKTLFEAFDRMEVLENTAHINYNLRTIGCSSRLSDEQINDIDNFGKN
ncbi:MAG: class II aldolase/adducin family protein [Bacteroidales bacterium]|nr:class II aldolase/adducin family protein [Bacteroidales bacterium]